MIKLRNQLTKIVNRFVETNKDSEKLVIKFYLNITENDHYLTDNRVMNIWSLPLDYCFNLGSDPAVLIDVILEDLTNYIKVYG
jgi:hypothetical protein